MLSYKGPEDGELTEPLHGIRSDQADLGEKEHHHGHLEHEPECQEQPGCKGEILLHGGKGLDILGGKAHEEFESIGKYDEVSEKGAKDKEDAGRRHKGDKVPFFVLVERRDQEHPHLVEDDRYGHYDAGNEGYLDIGNKHLGKIGEDESAVWRKDFCQGKYEKGEELFGEGIGDRETHANGDGAHDQPLPKFL